MEMHNPAPQVGAILWARLPEDGGDAKAKMRPVVVLDVSSLNGLTYVTVAEGQISTSTKCIWTLSFVRRLIWRVAVSPNPRSFATAPGKSFL